MNSFDCKQKFEVFAELTETLRKHMKENKIGKAINVAERRYEILVSFLESVTFLGEEGYEYVKKALDSVQLEQDWVKNNAVQERSNFISRKTAFKAYGLNGC